MHESDKISVAGHPGLVGSAILRKLQADGYPHFVTRTHAELDLTDQAADSRLLAVERLKYVILGSWAQTRLAHKM